MVLWVTLYAPTLPAVRMNGIIADVWLTYTVFAINNSALTLGGELAPFFIDRGAHPRLPLSLPDLRNSGHSTSAYAARMKEWRRKFRPCSSPRRRP